MNTLFPGIVIGALIGALLARFNRGSAGGAPGGAASWKQSALYGAMLGGLFSMVFGGAFGSYPVAKNVSQITETNFQAEVAQAGKPVVVDFYAPWCGPCKVLSPILDDLAGEFGPQIKFVSVNVDRAQSLAQTLNVQGIPTLLFVGRDGKVVDTSVGILSRESLRAKLESLANH